jgi:uncharacterized protein YndB with AHSA1/START domain
MLIKILIGLAAIIFLFLVIIAIQPSSFRITRTANIAAPADVVFAQVNDFHNWETWSPWAKLDPAAKKTFEGTPAGTGALFRWAGNSKVGEGRMTITESHPNDLIRLTLEFIKPFESTATTEFTFKRERGQTFVGWSMFSQRSFVEKAFCLFVNMDKMVGGDFEKGLTQMKAIAESTTTK